MRKRSMRVERVLLTFARAHTNARVALDEGSGGSGAKKGCDKKSVSKTRDRRVKKERKERASVTGEANCYILPPLKPSSVSDAQEGE